jgi:hypothetical protein
MLSFAERPIVIHTAAYLLTEVLVLLLVFSAFVSGINVRKILTSGEIRFPPHSFLKISSSVSLEKFILKLTIDLTESELLQ